MNRDKIYNTAEACVMVFEDFLEEHGIDIPNDEKDQSEAPAILYGTHYGDLVDSIDHVLRMYDRFEDEDKPDKPYRAERVPAHERIDEWDEWDAGLFPGWFIGGNCTLMGHGMEDPGWAGAREIVNSFDEFEALEIIADGYLAGEDLKDMQKILQTARAAEAVGGDCWSNLDRSTNAGEIAYVMVSYFRSEIVPEEDMIAYCLGITMDQKYKHCEIRGSVQREWNNCYYPVSEADLVGQCERMYYGLDEQFYVFKPGKNIPVFVTAYGANNEEEYKACIADEIGCNADEIELVM